VISPDRWFLNRIATHILAFEGESKVTFFDGNFTEYEEWRRQQLGEVAARPHRITYRKLTRVAGRHRRHSGSVPGRPAGHGLPGFDRSFIP
jgi:ATPase subunit of ABC transporter with duplicated ATPase domains